MHSSFLKTVYCKSILANLQNSNVIEQVKPVIIYSDESFRQGQILTYFGMQFSVQCNILVQLQCIPCIFLLARIIADPMTFPVMHSIVKQWHPWACTARTEFNSRDVIASAPYRSIHVESSPCWKTPGVVDSEQSISQWVSVLLFVQCFLFCYSVEILQY